MSKDTDGLENLFEPRDRSDGHNAVVNLSLWAGVGKSKRERGGGTYLLKLVREAGPHKLIKLGVCVPNWMRGPVRRGSSEMNDV